MDQVEFQGMPEPSRLCLQVADGQTLVTFERSVLYRYDRDDTGMRNLAIVALTDAGRRVDEVAAVFGLTATYVSMLRGRARTDGSVGLVRRRGRPPKLSERQVRQAGEWLLAGWTQQAIADRFGVARSVVSELRARLGPVPVQDELPEPVEASTEASAEEAGPGAVPDRAALAEAVSDEQAGAATVFAGASRVGTGTRSCRYAGAMLLHAYLHRVGAQTIFATLTGGPARRYDDLAILSTATLGFALGIDTLEGAKHLRRAEAGTALGVAAVPELKTLRTRFAALADGCDPLAVQRAFAARMLAVDPAGDPVYFVDDHFVAYAGARPVGKGWNTKRRHAQPGRDDTLLVDARGRAVVFDSGAAQRARLDPARRAGPAARGDRPGTRRCCSGSTGAGPTRSRLHRVPGRGRALGHLPARPAGRDDRRPRARSWTVRRRETGQPWSWPMRPSSSRGTAMRSAADPCTSTRTSRCCRS